MAVTPFGFPPLFRKPKNVEIPKRLGVRAVVVDSSNNFFSDTAGFSKSRFEPNVQKNASNKIIFQIFAFLIIAVVHPPQCFLRALSRGERTLLG